MTNTNVAEKVFLQYKGTRIDVYGCDRPYVLSPVAAGAFYPSYDVYQSIILSVALDISLEKQDKCYVAKCKKSDICVTSHDIPGAVCSLILNHEYSPAVVNDNILSNMFIREIH